MNLFTFEVTGKITNEMMVSLMAEAWKLMEGEVFVLYIDSAGGDMDLLCSLIQEVILRSRERKFHVVTVAGKTCCSFAFQLFAFGSIRIFWGTQVFARHDIYVKADASIEFKVKATELYKWMRALYYEQYGISRAIYAEFSEKTFPDKVNFLKHNRKNAIDALKRMKIIHADYDPMQYPDWRTLPEITNILAQNS